MSTGTVLHDLGHRVIVALSEDGHGTHWLCIWVAVHSLGHGVTVAPALEGMGPHRGNGVLPPSAHGCTQTHAAGKDLFTGSEAGLAKLCRGAGSCGSGVESPVAHGRMRATAGGMCSLWGQGGGGVGHSSTGMPFSSTI